MQQELVEFSFIVKTPYFDVTKGSIVVGKQHDFEVQSIDRIVLLESSEKQSNVVQVFATGILKKKKSKELLYEGKIVRRKATR